MRSRFMVVNDRSDGASIYRDGKLFTVVGSLDGATELVDLLWRAERLAERNGIVATPAPFQRRKIAAAIAMAMDYQLENETERKARLERERDHLLTDQNGKYDAGPDRDRLLTIERELAAMRTPLTFAAGFA